MLLQASRARVFLRLCIRHVRWLLLARSTRSNKTCLRAPPCPPPPLITRIPSPLASSPHLFAATFKVNSAKPRAPSMAAARHARARRSTCPSSLLKSKRLTRNWCWRQSAWTGKNGVRVFIARCLSHTRCARLSAEYEQLNGSINHNKQEHR